MSLDFPASAEALWDLYDTTGIRPEYAIVCMFFESGLDPSAVNSAGYAGLNQMAPGTYPDDYPSWPASRQIAEVIAPYWRAHVREYGVPRSAARLEQGNFYPASLKYARWLWSTIVSTKKGPDAYEANKGAFDPHGTGRITVGGIAHALALRAPAATAAIRQTYHARPIERIFEREPVYGDDFSMLEQHPLTTGALALAFAGVAYARPAWIAHARRLLWD